jgi:hypothetical protein
MTANITWAVTSMSCYPQNDGNTDVVFDVYWTCSGEQDGFRGLSFNNTKIPLPSGPFTPYADLTQDQVLGWVWSNGVDKDATEAAVQKEINDQISPPVVNPPVPWA